MSVSYSIPNTATNVVWGPSLYNALNTSVLSDPLNQNKALYLDSSNVTQWGANSANTPVMLDNSGRIPTSLIPQSYDDLREYATASAFPAIGDDTNGVIYYALDTGNFYRWNGTIYINLSTINFYNKTQIDALNLLKLDKTGGTLTGALNLGANSLTTTGTANITNANITNLTSNLNTSTFDLTGTGNITSTTANFTNLNATNLGSNINGNAKTITGLTNLTSTASTITTENTTTLNATTGNITTLNATNLGSNLGGNAKTITGLTNITSTASTITTENTTTLNATTGNITTLNATTLGGDINANSKNIGLANTIACANMNCSKLGGCLFGANMNVGGSDLNACGSIYLDSVATGRVLDMGSVLNTFICGSINSKYNNTLAMYFGGNIDVHKAMDCFNNNIVNVNGLAVSNITPIAIGHVNFLQPGSGYTNLHTSTRCIKVPFANSGGLGTTLSLNWSTGANSVWGFTSDISLINVTVTINRLNAGTQYDTFQCNNVYLTSGGTVHAEILIDANHATASGNWSVLYCPNIAP